MYQNRVPFASKQLCIETNVNLPDCIAHTMRYTLGSIQHTTLHEDGSSAFFNIALEKEGGKKNKQISGTFFIIASDSCMKITPTSR